MVLLHIFQKYSVADLMRTSVEHITDQIVKIIQGDVSPGDSPTRRSLLVTGGGSLNTLLISTLGDKLTRVLPHVTLTETDSDTINFKEALVFAFLGLRLLLGINNISSKVTGARCDSLSGSIHVPTSAPTSTFPGAPSTLFHMRRSSSAASPSSPLPNVGSDSQSGNNVLSTCHYSSAK